MDPEGRRCTRAVGSCLQVPAASAVCSLTGCFHGHRFPHDPECCGVGAGSWRGLVGRGSVPAGGRGDDGGAGPGPDVARRASSGRGWIRPASTSAELESCAITGLSRSEIWCCPEAPRPSCLTASEGPVSLCNGSSTGADAIHETGGYGGVVRARSCREVTYGDT